MIQTEAPTEYCCCCLVDADLGAEEAADLAGRFKALGDAGRVLILSLLVRNEELCVCDLQTAVGLAQPTVSHHLAVLKRAGLVEADVRGRWAFYRARKDRIADLSRVLEVSA